ncbi:MAG: type II toxin-antitoxin system RelE family toxin [Nanoarchaeota archaeon]
MDNLLYDIEFTKSSKKQFLKLNKDLQKRIKNSLLRVRVRPYSYVKKLIDEDVYRLRIGDYRIILDINNNKLIILVISIKHRKNMYKNL